MESEVNENTHDVLLEGASWNMTNIRRTARTQNLPSEASYRFTRGVPQSMAERGVRRGLELMLGWAGGSIDPQLVDEYPSPQKSVQVEITPQDVKRWLGLELSANRIAELLARLEFKVEVERDLVRATCPDFRMDIGTGITGKSDLVEEIARIHGYDLIPETRISDRLPLQKGNVHLERVERIRDLLVALGLQEVINYRWTTPEKEKRLLAGGNAGDDRPYLTIANPLAYEKSFLRHSVLSSLLDTAERNARRASRLVLFEIGPVFLQSEAPDGLPDEQERLSLLMAGQRNEQGWQKADDSPMDFYDLKGILEDLLEGLNIPDVTFQTGEAASFHPGKCANLFAGGQQIGVCGELHPVVREQFEWGETFKFPILAADLNLDLLLQLMPELTSTKDVPGFPALVEDLAIVLDDDLPAVEVEKLIRRTGGNLLVNLTLFDVFYGGQIGSGKKSLAYRLTYQAPDRTLTDSEVNQVRTKIIKRLNQELGAKLRS